ncbi:TPA: hypothetical protein ACW7J1_002084 [Citrobacter freundii]
MDFDGGTTQYANWCAIERRKKKEERRKKKEERRKKKEERRKKKEDAYVTILLISNISPTGYCGKANHCISCIT